MIKNDALQNRLNSRKEGLEAPIFKNEYENPIPTTSKDASLEELSEQEKSPSQLSETIFWLFSVAFKSFIYGMSLKIVLNTSWNFLSLWCVGLSILYLHQLILSFSKKQ